jgi:DNA end-binding protein Ku
LSPFDRNIDPVYFDSPYFVYPDGPIAVEVLRVIGAAMAKVGVVGLGRLTLSRRERMVVVEPRGTGMALFTLRAAGEVRVPQFGSTGYDHQAADRQFRPEHLPRPLSGGVAAAD